MGAGGDDGKLIAAVVIGMIGVAFGPLPDSLMAADLFVEILPEVLVLDGLLVFGAPVVALPGVDPLGDALADVFAIGGDCDLTVATASSSDSKKLSTVSRISRGVCFW